MDKIISISNGRIANVRKLISSKEYRYQRKQYVAEGVNIVNDIPSEYIEEIYITDKGFEKLKHNSIDNMYFVSDKVMQAMSDTKSPAGILAVCKMPEFCKICDIGSRAILADNLNDPGNMGTIIRTAVACGVEYLLLYGDCVDVYSSKVVRASMGGITHVIPIIINDLTELPNNLLVLDMAGTNIYDMTEMPKDFILVVGSEAHGVSSEIKERAKHTISLPMSDKMESLNAGVSLSIALYHLINGGI